MSESRTELGFPLSSTPFPIWVREPRNGRPSVFQGFGLHVVKVMITIHFLLPSPSERYDGTIRCWRCQTFPRYRASHGPRVRASSGDKWFHRGRNRGWGGVGVCAQWLPFWEQRGDDQHSECEVYRCDEADCRKLLGDGAKMLLVTTMPGVKVSSQVSWEQVTKNLRAITPIPKVKRFCLATSAPLSFGVFRE